MVHQMSVSQLHDRLKEPDRQPMIVDVREPWEFQLCALPDSVHIPMGQIVARIKELPRDRDLVIVCHHGNRSQRVGEYLASQGLGPIHNLSGGVDAWAREIDPSLPTY